MIEYYYDRKKFGIIIAALKNLLKDNKNTTCIIDKVADAYITARGNSDDYLDLDRIIKNVKEFYDKVVLH